MTFDLGGNPFFVWDTPALEAVTAKWHRRHIDEYNSLPFHDNFKARQMFKNSFLSPSLKRSKDVSLSSDIEQYYGLVKDGYWQFSQPYLFLIGC